MATYLKQRPPAWFWIVAILFLLWGAMGCWACYQQFRIGADAWGDPANAEYNRALYAALPAWYNYVYAIAVGTALLGALALLARSAAARLLFIVSAIAIVVQFGYAFLATDLIAHKGAAAVLPFPILILVIALVEIWFAGLARRRGWIS